jgi:hypothetical protein
LNPASVDQELTKQLAAYKVNMLGRNRSAFAGSPIVNKEDQSLMMRAVGDVKGWKNFTPAGLDTLKQRLTGYASDASGQAQPFFYRIAAAAKDELNTNVPGYQALTKDYEDASELLKTVRKELSADHPNPGTTFRKLSYALNQHNEFRKVLLEDLDRAAGTDVSGQIAGYHLRQLVPRGLAGVGAGLAAAYEHDPRALLAGAIGSPRVAGELMSLVSSMRKYTPNAAKSLSGSAVAPAITNQVLPTPLMPPPR